MNLQTNMSPRLSERNIYISVAIVLSCIVSASGPLSALFTPTAYGIPVGTSRIVHSKPVPGAVIREYAPPSKRWLAGHRGVDIAARVGDSIYASAPGVVTFSGSINGMSSLSITHSDGIRSTYQPINAVIEKGVRVRKGQLIGHLAVAERHPEPGLHWGALRGREYLNPMSLLGARKIILKPVIRSE